MGFPIESDQHQRPDLAGVVAHSIAVVGGCGYAPIAPGTVGSAAGVVFFVAVVALLDSVGLGTASRGAEALAIHVALVVGLCALGVWASGRTEERFGRHDDGRIVIDEVAGQWIALLPLAAPAWWFGSAGEGLYGGGSGVSFDGFSGGAGFFSAVVTGFVLFRVFDVWKPGMIRWVERRLDGGWGVMADDLVAGAHAALVLSLVVLLQARAVSEPAVSGGVGA